MDQESSLRAILGEWLKLPEDRRRTENDAVAFAFKVLKERPDLCEFKYPRGDKYQPIKNYILRHGMPKG